jgi:hypothetical protein
VSTFAYFIFICFDKLEETQTNKGQVKEQYKTIRKIVNFLVTFPSFSWFGVQGFLQKELLLCLPLQDVKSARKYTFLAELSRVFKNIIGLFLTTSYVLLRIRHTVNTPEPEDYAEIILSEPDFIGSFTYDYLIDFLLPVGTLCLTLVSIMVEL